MPHPNNYLIRSSCFNKNNFSACVISSFSFLNEESEKIISHEFYYLAQPWKFGPNWSKRESWFQNSRRLTATVSTHKFSFLQSASFGFF